MYLKSASKLFKSLFVLLFLTCFSLALKASAPSAKPINTKIKFYSATLDLNYDPSMLTKTKHCTSHSCVKRFYTKLEETNYKVLLDHLLNYKEELQLNDWFFYKLVRTAVDKIYASKKSMYRTSVTWFIMTKAGYETRLYTAQNKYTFLYVRSDDKVFNTPFIKLNNRQYINLTAIHYKIDTRLVFFEMPKFQPGAKSKKIFSFSLDNMPDVPARTIDKNISFSVGKEDYNLSIEVDTMGNTLLNNFPITEPINYIKAPMSPVTMESIRNEMAALLKDKDINEQLSIFLSLTRKAFPYKNDQVRFRHDQPLTADQLMVSDSSDHEDRCALLYNLLTEFTDLNFVVVQYIHDDIVTIGVELPEVVGKPFEYEGVQYTICDPTIPSNSSKLGIYPISLDKDIKILDVVRQN